MKKIILAISLLSSFTAFAQNPYFDCVSTTVYPSGAKFEKPLYFSVFGSDFSEWEIEGYKVRVEKFNDGRPFTMSVSKEGKAVFSDMIQVDQPALFEDENFSTELLCRVEVPT
jgi:hypothetical protein